MDIINNTAVDELMNDIAHAIVEQSDSFKIHKNKGNFLDNVSDLIKQRDSFSVALCHCFNAQHDLKRLLNSPEILCRE